GGAVADVTRLERQTANHRFPHFLPDGRQFLFDAQGSAESQGIYLGSLDKADVKRLIPADSFAIFAQPGWLLYSSQSTLYARRFDAGTGEISGEPIAIANPIAGMISASSSGVIAYRAEGVLRQQLTWFDRSGRPLEKVGAIESGGGLSHPQIAPDGRRIAMD